MTTDADAARQLEALRASKRWLDALRYLREWAARTPDPELQARLWAEAGMTALEYFANHAEAVSCFEASLRARPGQAELEARLREFYEKRRDWEKLLPLARSDQERLQIQARLEARPWWRRLLGG
ncbi:MAG: hypothetical protein JW940_13965 [Polyangiaceae bacterium]|nr:hypothetical protein [Polyangiaceae bacterium]